MGKKGGPAGHGGNASKQKRPRNQGHGHILYKEEVDPLQNELFDDEETIKKEKIRDVSYLEATHTGTGKFN